MPDVPVTILITTIDGTEVRISSWGGEEYHPDTGATPIDALSLDELVALAEGLGPVE